jgi:RNA polymerase sigma-70 factor (ECF subfamily)
MTGEPKEQKPAAGRTMDALLMAVSESSDKDAFKALYEYYAPRLKSFLLGQGTGSHMAEEIVQETMVKVWRKASLFDPAKASASTWIFTIGRNLRIDMLRKANRPKPDFDDPAFLPDPEPLATDAIFRQQQDQLLIAAVNELSDAQSEILRLAFFQEKSHGQIAEELGLPLGTVKSRVRLALKKLRSEIGEKE